MQFLYKAAYLKAYDRCTGPQQVLLQKADETIQQYYRTGIAPVGLGVKLLHRRGVEKVFEGRVNLQFRLLWVERPGRVTFVMIGSHDDVRRFLKAL